MYTGSLTALHSEKLWPITVRSDRMLAVVAAGAVTKIF
jgi:hypothetical protein